MQINRHKTTFIFQESYFSLLNFIFENEIMYLQLNTCKLQKFTSLLWQPEKEHLGKPSQNVSSWKFDC